MADQNMTDPVNQVVLDVRDRHGIARFGLINNQVWHVDPRRVLFSMSRYKFVSKMLAGRKNVLEVGCGDAFNARIIVQEVERFTVTDFDPVLIQDAIDNMSPDWPCEAKVHDMLQAPLEESFDAAFSLDVLEHIPREKEQLFIGNIVKSLPPDGVLIVGMSSLESQDHASPPSRAGHVNCKTGADLKAVMDEVFHNVFMFSMND